MLREITIIFIQNQNFHYHQTSLHDRGLCSHNH